LRKRLERCIFLDKFTKNCNFKFFVGILFLISGCSCKTSYMNKTVVKEFDLNRYLGTWYEIARYDHRFERALVGVTATYSLREEGKIRVVNRGYKGSFDGKMSEAIGKAKIPDPNQKSRLKVSFFLFFYADYLIMELDPDYQWAVVGSKSDNYLWILSRKPIIEEDLYQEILEKLRNRGYNTGKLIKVEQR